MGAGYRLKEAREERGYTQKQIAAVIGVTRSAYNQYERGRRDIPIESVIKLADYYQCSTDEILGSWAYNEGLTS